MGRRIFFADFLAGFFLIFVGKSAQKNPPGKSPAKSSKIYTTKIPDTFLQRGRAGLSGPTSSFYSQHLHVYLAISSTASDLQVFLVRQGPLGGFCIFYRGCREVQLLTCFHASFFLFARFAGHPSSSLGTFSPFSPLKNRSVL